MEFCAVAVTLYILHITDLECGYHGSYVSSRIEEDLLLRAWLTGVISRKAIVTVAILLPEIQNTFITCVSLVIRARTSNSQSG